MRPFDQSLPLIEDEDDQDFNPYEDKERPPSDEFVDCEDNGSSSGSTTNVDLLQERCKELEARVSELSAELDQSKKNLYYDGSGSDSISRSDLSKTSAREGDSSCEFPLVLALAATAGGMTSSSEADRSNLLDQELASVRRNIGKHYEMIYMNIQSFRLVLTHILFDFKDQVLTTRTRPSLSWRCVTFDQQ